MLRMSSVGAMLPKLNIVWLMLLLLIFPPSSHSFSPFRFHAIGAFFLSNFMWCSAHKPDLSWSLLIACKIWFYCWCVVSLCVDIMFMWADCWLCLAVLLADLPFRIIFFTAENYRNADNARAAQFTVSPVRNGWRARLVENLWGETWWKAVVVNGTSGMDTFVCNLFVFSCNRHSSTSELQLASAFRFASDTEMYSITCATKLFNHFNLLQHRKLAAKRRLIEVFPNEVYSEIF